jgi:hypothetical protein
MQEPRQPPALVLGRATSGMVPSPLVGVGQGGGESQTSKIVVPPTPNPSPQGGGGRLAQPAE